MPLNQLAGSFSSVPKSLTPGASIKDLPELRYPTPHLSSVRDGPSLDSLSKEPQINVEKEQDPSNVELSDHPDKLFIEDNRFFGQSR